MGQYNMVLVDLARLGSELEGVFQPSPGLAQATVYPAWWYDNCGATNTLQTALL